MRETGKIMKKVVFLVLVLLAQLSFSASVSMDPKSIYNSQSEWENQEGIPQKLLSLKGGPVVVAMVYTGCQASCPLTMADLRKIEKRLSLKAKQKVRFAVFSFDSQRDTPEKLKAYLQKQKLDATHWSFYHGSEKSVRELAALLGIQFKKIEGGDFDHSNVISVLNSEGVVVHQQLGLAKSPQETVMILEKMIEKKGI